MYEVNVKVLLNLENIYLAVLFLAYIKTKRNENALKDANIGNLLILGNENIYFSYQRLRFCLLFYFSLVNITSLTYYFQKRV